jgi:hypothetical protein
MDQKEPQHDSGRYAHLSCRVVGRVVGRVTSDRAHLLPVPTVLDFTSVAGEIKYTLMYNKSCPSIVEKCKGTTLNDIYPSIGVPTHQPTNRATNLPTCPVCVRKDYRPTILRAISEALAIHYGNASEAAFELYESVYPEIAPPSDGTRSNPLPPPPISRA